MRSKNFHDNPKFLITIYSLLFALCKKNRYKETNIYILTLIWFFFQARLKNFLNVVHLDLLAVLETIALIWLLSPCNGQLDQGQKAGLQLQMTEALFTKSSTQLTKEGNFLLILKVTQIQTVNSFWSFSKEKWNINCPQD